MESPMWTTIQNMKVFLRSEEQSRIIANMFEDLAKRGRFDEEGGELSDEDWNDVRHRPLPGFRLGDQLYPS